MTQRSRKIALSKKNDFFPFFHQKQNMTTKDDFYYSKFSTTHCTYCHAFLGLNTIKNCWVSDGFTNGTIYLCARCWYTLRKPSQCRTCNCKFWSRNQLFNHLYLNTDHQKK